MASEHQYCSFYLDGLYLGVQVCQVQEVLRYQRMTPIPLAPGVVCGLINLRGQIVTALDLRQRLGLPTRDWEWPPMNVVVRTPEGAVSFLVDEIGEVLELDDVPFERPPSTLQGVGRELIRGAYKLRDCLLLVLDAERVIDLSAGVPN